MYWWFLIFMFWKSAFVFTARTGFLEIPVSLFPRVCMLSCSCRLTWEYSIGSWLRLVRTGFPELDWPSRSSSTFSRLTGLLKSCGGFFLALSGLCNTRLMGFIGFGFSKDEPSLEVASCPLFDMALCFPITSERKLKKKGCKRTSRNSWCWTNEEDDSTRHAWNSLWLACQKVGSCCQHIWFRSSVLNWFGRTTNQAQLCGFWTCVSLMDFVLWWSSWWQLRCLQKMYNRDSPWEECVLVGA